MFDFKSMTAEEKIKKAKIKLQKPQPFFGFILMNMQVKKAEETLLQVPSMGVDAYGNLYYNDKWVHGLSEEELTGVMCHEAMHIALMHLQRRGSRNPQLFNIANDLVVNCTIQNQGMALPKEGCIPDRYQNTFEINGHKIEKINEKSSEEIYEELDKILPKQTIKMIAIALNGGEGDGEGGGSSQLSKELRDKLKGIDVHIYADDKGKADGDSEGGDPLKKFPVSELQKWRKIIAEAASIAKNQGKLPSGMERMIEGLLESRIPWTQALYKFVVKQLPYDYNWSHPHRKSSSVGVYLPSVLKEGVKGVFHIDTSGSMCEEDLRQALTELQAIIEAFNSVDLDILVGDAAMQATFQLTSHNKEDIIGIAKEMKGGGGTDHQYVFEHVLENLQDVKFLICFTDGYTSFPVEHEYPFETMWLISKGGVEDKQIPFGDVLRIDRE